MPRRGAGALLAAAAAALLLASPASALRTERLRVPGALASSPGGLVVSGEALVRFEASLSSAARAEGLRRVGAEYGREVGATGWTHVLLPPGLDVAAGLGALKRVPGLLEAAPDNFYPASKTTANPSETTAYHYGKVNAFAAWEYETGGSNLVTVAVMDSGIEGNHPDLDGKLVANRSAFCDPGACKSSPGGCADFTADNTACRAQNSIPAPGEDPLSPACNHGTRVAGVAAAEAHNGQVVGLSWEARLISIKVFKFGDCSGAAADCLPVNTCGTDDKAIADGIAYAQSIHGAADVGQVVLNMSIGGCVGGAPPCGACPAAVQAAVNAAVAAGVVLVAAAGNDGPSDGTMNAPGNCTGVIPVGATDSNDNIASFSSRGTALANSGLVAPGVGILSTTPGQTTASSNGTSFATPIVAGVAALMKAAKPAMTPAQVQATLRGSVNSIGALAAAGYGAAEVSASAGPLGNSAGAGRLNAYQAMRLAVKGTLADFEGKQKAIAFPNPFRPSLDGFATITIPDSIAGRKSQIKVYTIDGQLVRDLGGNTSWDGKNDNGAPVASGTYIFLVQTDAGMQRGRVAVVR